MSDLISRKAVMDWLRGLQAQSIINENHGSLVDATISTTVNHFINFIVQVPTAYDVNKVVEKLEEAKETHDDECGFDDFEFLDCDIAIEIVKGGGID